MILGGDVGGTRTTLALLEPKNDALEIVRLENYLSREHASLDEIVAKFASGFTAPVTAAGFGVAGPVVNGRVSTMNLPWLVDGAKLASQLGLPRVALLNDIEAQAWSIEWLEPTDVLTLQEGVAAPTGNIGVIAAGTGLGFAALIHSARGLVSLSSQGGLANFAPRVEIEVELFGELRARFGHVNIERVLSGPGILNVYLFLRDSGRGEQPQWLSEEMDKVDASVAIGKAGIDGTSALCEQTLELFLAMYGAESGSWALRTFARGGLYVCGELGAKLLCGQPGTRGWSPSPT